MYKLDYLKGTKEDIANLEGSQKKLVEKSLKRIQSIGMQAGEQLHGNLHTCRKLKHKKARLRVIFRQSSKGIEIIEIVVVGKRSDSEVYKIAEKRLNK